jgi:hypothetical protein
MNSSRLLLAAGWFSAGVICAIVAPKLFRLGLSHVVFPEHRVELSRVTSPDADVDAVMIRSDCGARCSTNYSVFLVPKGNRVRENSDQAAFSAVDMSDEHLAWKQPHLLEVAYGRAFILGFQNVSYPFKETVKSQKPIYRVEIRLAPISPGFSYLTEADTR